MTLHIFNPEHDIALASGLANFTAPHAGRQLRHDLGFLPAIWAKEGDVVLVDDAEQAARSWRKLAHRVRLLLGSESSPCGNCEFTQGKLGVPTGGTLGLDPWGWNSALCALLVRRGVDRSLLPDSQQLQTIRDLSHRRLAAALLPKLRMEGTVGEAFECQTPEQVESLMAQYGQLVMKAPWSSSGRGLRFVNPANNVQNSTYLAGWFRNVVKLQGSVMVEPLYNKVKDFGMEFFSDGEGHVNYLGLSLFHTENGAYTGNVLATEKVKQEMISRYIPAELLQNIQEKICLELGETYRGKYRGPFGIDMMAVNNGQWSTVNGQWKMANGQCLLHPCVEINLRRTMGHVALALSPKDDDLRRVMRIEYSKNNYQLIINRL